LIVNFINKILSGTISWWAKSFRLLPVASLESIHAVISRMFFCFLFTGVYIWDYTNHNWLWLSEWLFVHSPTFLPARQNVGANSCVCCHTNIRNEIISSADKHIDVSNRHDACSLPQEILSRQNMKKTEEVRTKVCTRVQTRNTLVPKLLRNHRTRVLTNKQKNTQSGDRAF